MSRVAWSAVATCVWLAAGLLALVMHDNGHAVFFGLAAIATSILSLRE